MFRLEDALGKVSGEHQAALRWFLDHRDREVTWANIKANLNDGARLVNQAKGIYKPHYTDYALSVRQTLNSPYADKEIIRRPDGSWVYPYYQENPDPAQRDREATNRGLVKCMDDGVPIGVLIQRTPKPGVIYEVLGLGLVTEWKSGYFLLQGFPKIGDIGFTRENPDVAYDRARADATPAAIDDFNPAEIGDGRDRAISEIIRRRGQARFRASLLAAYEGRCVITNCDAVEALEAAHIVPYRGVNTHHTQNGLLLRADIHSLFDLGLLAIDPETMTVVLSDALLRTSYASLAGQVLNKPNDLASSPSVEALTQHMKWAGLTPHGSRRD